MKPRRQIEAEPDPLEALKADLAAHKAKTEADREADRAEIEAIKADHAELKAAHNELEYQVQVNKLVASDRLSTLETAASIPPAAESGGDLLHMKQAWPEAGYKSDGGLRRRIKKWLADPTDPNGTPAVRKGRHWLIRRADLPARRPVRT
jgi:hypothetical protein